MSIRQPSPSSSLNNVRNFQPFSSNRHGDYQPSRQPSISSSSTSSSSTTSSLDFSPFSSRSPSFSSSSSSSEIGRRYDTDSENEEEESNDTTYAGTMIDKPEGVAAAQPRQTNAYTPVCTAISKISKSNLPTSLFDTSFQKTQDFLINGPQVLTADNRTRGFRVRSGGKKTRRYHPV